VEHASTNIIPRLIVIKLDIVIEVEIEEEGEQQSAINPEQDKLEHGGHEKLVCINRNCLYHIGQRRETIL
jgi:hypothetical protein